MYVILLILFYILYVIEDYCKQNKFEKWINENSFCKLLFTIIILIVGGRSLKVGVDTIGYSNLFFELARLSWSEIFSAYTHNAVEIGYVILMKSCYIICQKYYFFQFINAIITYGLFYKFIKSNAINKRLCILLLLSTGIFFSSFNIMRQVLAVSVLTYAYTSLLQKKYFKYTIVIIIACLIHISSLIGLSFIVLTILNRNDRIAKLLPILLMTLPIFGEILIYIFFIGTGEKYITYIQNNREIQTAGFIKIIWFIEITIILYLLYFNKSNSNTKLISSLSLLFIVFNIMGLSINYAERVGLIYIPYVWLLFDRFIITLKDKYTRDLFQSFIFGIFSVIYILSSNGTQLSYSSFLF